MNAIVTGATGDENGYIPDLLQGVRLMPIYDWFLLVLAALGLAMAVSAVVTGLRGLARREYGAAIMFVIIGAGFAAAGLYTGYLATTGATL